MKNPRSSSPKPSGPKRSFSRPSGPKPSFSKPSFSKPSGSAKPSFKFGSKPPDTPHMMKDQGGFVDQGMGYRPSFWQRRYGPRGGCGCTSILIAIVLIGICLAVVAFLAVFGQPLLRVLGIG